MLSNFQKDDAVKVLHSICQQIWKTQQWPQDRKMSVFIPISKKGNAIECSNYRTIALISHASKVMLKILQARLQQYVNCELPDVQARFRKGRRTRDQIANICWIIEKAREFQKKHQFCFIDYAKAFDCVDHNKLWKIVKESPEELFKKRKKNKDWDITLLDYKLYYKATVKFQELVQKQTHRSREQNREPRNKLTLIWSINLQQRRQEYTTWKRQSLQ